MASEMKGRLKMREKKLSMTLKMNLRIWVTMDWTDHKNYSACLCAKLKFIIMYKNLKKSDVLLRQTLCSVTAQIIYNVHFFTHFQCFY